MFTRRHARTTLVELHDLMLKTVKNLSDVQFEDLNHEVLEHVRKDCEYLIRRRWDTYQIEQISNHFESSVMLKEEIAKARLAIAAAAKNKDMQNNVETGDNDDSVSKPSS